MKKRYALVLVSFLIIALLVYYSGPEKIFAVFSRSDKPLLLAALVFSTAAALLRTLKWKLLLKGVSFSGLLPVQLLGSTISNFTPGKVGEPAKSLLLKMKAGIPVSKSLPSIIWERVMDVITLLLLSALFISSFPFLYAQGIIGASVFAAVLVLFLLVIHSKNFGVIVFSVLRKLPVTNRISRQFIETFYREKINGANLFLSFLVTFFTWVIDGFVFYLSFRSIGIDMNPLFFSGLLAVSTLIGIATFLPGGLGSTDAVMVFALSTAIPGASAVAGVLIARALTFWYSAFLGYLSFLHMSKSMDMKKLL